METVELFTLLINNNMPTNKVNNNIKLKEDGGVKNDATDGLSLDSGTAAFQAVQLDEDSKLPAVDGSNLLNLQNAPVFFTAVSDNLVTTGGGGSFPATASYTKYKEIEYNDVDGNIRVYFGGYMSNNNGSKAKLRVYVNGVAVGTERTVGWSDTGGDYYTDDIAVSTGDLIQLYAYTYNGSGGGVITAFNLKYIKSVITATNTVNL